MKIALIGLGGMGATHNRCLKLLSSLYPLEVSELADLVPERRKAGAALWPAAKVYETADDLLAHTEADLIYICLPSYLHAHYALKAMELGKAVFSEKPVCLTEADCQALLAKQKATGVPMMVGQVVRFFPDYAYLKSLKDSGVYGSLKSVVLQRISADPVWGWQDWFNDAERSGSVILDLHIHDVDYLRYLLGEPTSLSAVATRFPSGMVNQIITTYHFGDTLAVAEGVWHQTGNLPFSVGYRAEFEKATVVCHGFQKDPVAVYPAKGEPFCPPFDDLPAIEDKDNGLNVHDLGAYFLEDRYFVECLLKHKKNTIAPLEEAVASVRLCLQEAALVGGVK